MSKSCDRSPGVTQTLARLWRSGSRPAFSMVELLVVIAIFLFLLAMLFPGLASVRESGRRVLCKNNLRQWGIAYQAYRHDYNDYLPMEGTYLGRGVERPGTWYNELPLYLDLPSYKDLERIEDQIKELPELHVWICPSKNAGSLYKSGSGKNQFHYGMNQVLDGLGSVKRPSPDAPDFPDQGAVYQQTSLWSNHSNTVLMFDIFPNSPAGTPRGVATVFQRDRHGARVARFHGDYANILYLNGSVGNCTTDDLVTDRDFRNGDIIWHHPTLYWGYTPPTTAAATDNP